jgi:aldose 1-epimerase
VESVDESNIHIRLVSPDGDQGFPGTLRVNAHYSLGDDNALTLAFEATTSAPTIINLTNHTYWNLAGAGGILDHILHVDADFITPLNGLLIPTGAISPVGGTPFDFRKPSSLRQRVTKSNDRQIGFAGGIDHNFIINSRATRELTRAATLCDPRSGRSLEVLTTEPGLQVYSGNSLAGGPPGKRGAPYQRWDGIALETQHFPDSPNRPAFPTTVLRPGNHFRSTTIFRLT